MAWFLRYEADGRDVKAGDKVESRGDTYYVAKGVGRPPHHEGSSGRVWVVTKKKDVNTSLCGQEYFPGVFKMQWEWEYE